MRRRGDNPNPPAIADIHVALEELRRRLEPAFGPDTAIPNSALEPASAGHCAAVAAIVYARFGGTLVSAIVDGQSHWFNRLHANGTDIDVDLTGDQFGQPAVQITSARTLHEPSRVRAFEQLLEETRHRAVLLARRAELFRVAEELLPAEKRPEND